MIRSISLPCLATSIDQASNGFPPNNRMFFPGTDLLPPRAGMTAMPRFQFIMGCVVPASSFNSRPGPQPAGVGERLSVFGPFPGIAPSILADREDADAPASLFDLLDEIGHVAPCLLRNQIKPVAAHNIHSGIDEKAVLRLFHDAGETAALFQFAHSVRNVIVLEGRD